MDVLAQFPHHGFDLEKGQCGPAADVNEHIAGTRQHLSAVQQGALQSQAEGFHGAVFALGEAESEEAPAIRIPQSGDQIVHADMDQPLLRDETGHGPDALSDDFIG